MRAQPLAASNSENKLGRYQLVVPLGQGGMGTIHLAVDGGLSEFRKLVVVKELRQDLTRSPRFVEMFLNEARLAARLNHRNVVHTIEAGREDDRYFLSMEFLDGQPFSAFLNRPNRSLPPPPHQRTEPPVSLAIRLRILSEVLAGLHYAHELSDYDGTKLQIVHRDVSPQNIFVTYDGQVKVVDFGIAKAAVIDSVTTAPGVFKGKFGYAAPEQVSGEPIDARTDVFAVGVILWEALTMQRFADVPVSRASVAARLAGDEPRIGRVMPRLDPRLIAICDRALQVDPDARYASADDFRNALESYLVACGQRVDSASITQVMSAKFTAERRAMHRLIDAHSKNEPLPDPSTIETLLGSEVGNDNPTAETDLSPYVKNEDETVVRGIEPYLIHASFRPEPRPEPPPRERGWLIAGAGLVALGLAFAYSQLTAGAEMLTATSLPLSAAGVSGITPGTAVQSVPPTLPVRVAATRMEPDLPSPSAARAPEQASPELAPGAPLESTMRARRAMPRVPRQRTLRS
jgi:serine/threonine protein kinase